MCAFGFHNPVELDAIRSELPPSDFVFTDLTAGSGESGPLQSESEAPDRNSGVPAWLLDRCRPDLRCDVVIFSGEFAGGFFGKYGVSLKLQEMEEAACLPRCQGLFRAPREVFLLACNTLASKGADDRTPQEYLQVLLAHGFSRPDAERVVDLRYGPLGPSFHDSTRRIFMGVPRIYGFSSVAPTGEVTAPRLHQYFQRKGDYATYLRDAGRDTAINEELRAAFAGTSLMQTKGLTPLEPVAADRSLVCRLYDESEIIAERLRIVYRLLARPDFLAFVPTIEVFFSRHPPEQLGSAERPLLQKIQALEVPRRQMKELMHQLHVSGLQAQMAHLALQLGWIAPDEFERFAIDAARQLLAEPISSEVADIACELARYAPAGASLKLADIPEQMFLHWEGFQLLDCLAPRDPQLSAKIVDGLKDIDESIRSWAAYALSRRLPLADDVLLRLADSLDDPSPGVRQRVRWIFTVQKPRAPRVLAVVRERDPELAKTLAVP